MNRTFAALLVCVSACLSLQTLAQTTPASSDALELARVELERNHWPEAFALLAQLADQGEPEASRLAWQMWRYGEVLYGQRFDASRAQIERWSHTCQCTLLARRP